MTVPRAIATLLFALMLILYHYLVPTVVTETREIGQVLETLERFSGQSPEGGAP